MANMVRSCKFADMAEREFLEDKSFGVLNAQSNSWDSGLGTTDLWSQCCGSNYFS